MKKSLLIILFSTFFCNVVFSAAPNWDINPNNYQFSSTITAIAELNCSVSPNENDQLAAFVNGELRGFTNFDVAINNQQFAFLIVYSNQALGEEIELKMYNIETDSVYDILNTYQFEENATFGNASNPEFLSNNFRPTSISYSNLNITDQSAIGDTVAMFEVEVNGITDYNFQLLGNDFDNNMFQFENEFLVLAENIDFANQSTFTILVEGFDGNGCSIDSLFEISATNTNEPPIDIFFINDENNIDENLPDGTEVGLLNAEDSTPDDVFTFELMGDTLDNDAFEIEGNALLSTQVFDYETKNEYEIYVKVTDASGNTFEKLLQVFINDIIEFDDLKAGNLVTPNGDGFNDFFEVPNVFLYTNYTLSIYNENGNLLFSSNSYANNWGGTTNNGKALPSGTYYYSFKDANSEEGFTGVLYLIRD